MRPAVVEQGQKGEAVAAFAAAGCATGAGPGLVMTLEPSTTRVEGWLASYGQLTVFPRPLKPAFDPYAEDERAWAEEGMKKHAVDEATYPAKDLAPVFGLMRQLEDDDLTFWTSHCIALTRRYVE